MKYYIILLLLSFSLTSFPQNVEKDGKTYEIKNEKIFLNGEDVTETLSIEERTLLLKEASVVSEKMKVEEKLKKEKEKA